jgi:type VII secretion-associated serine protease mycosin
VRAAVVAGLVLAGMAGVVPGAAAAGTDGGTTLPQIPTVLQGAKCTKPSTKRPAAPPWQQVVLNPSGAWDLTEGAGVTVAVVDTGVDAKGSPALAGRVTVGPDVVSGGSAGTDCVGHGTFVAGLIAAGKSDDVGFAGVAPGTRILAVRVTEHDGSTTPDHVAAGIEAAVKGGARVVNVPIALPRDSAALRAAVQAARQQDVLIVAPAYAAQEDTETKAPAAYPAALPGVLAVASLAPPGDSVVSAQAPTTAPNLAAPGESVMSIGPGGSGYFTGSGAEFASALVAGTAALTRSYRPDLTVSQVTARLERTAYHAAVVGPSPLVGWGVVDPAAAVTVTLPSTSRGGGAGAQQPFRLAAPASDSAERRAWVVAGGATGVILLAALVGAVVPRGRRRGWRPGVLGEVSADGGVPASGGAATS